MSLGHLYKLKSPCNSYMYAPLGIIHMINGLIVDRANMTLLAKNIKKTEMEM